MNLLRQIEVAVGNGKTTVQACKEASITEVEKGNVRLKRLVANLSLGHLVLKNFASGDF